MRALDKKLLRDLWHLRGQVLAIAVVMASGVAVVVMSLGTVEALEQTATAYYERYRFAELFSGLKRAPEPLADQIAALPGVQSVETRIVRYATLEVAGFDEPLTGQLISLPDRRPLTLNRLAVRKGRLPRSGHPDDAVLHEAFAEAHGLNPGSSLGAVINGHRRTLRVVGIALSPEHVYALGPGALIPDERRFGILWMGREALAAAFDLDGAFNDVALTLRRGSVQADVIHQLDVLLDRHGGTGAYDRSDQVSHWFVTNEMTQLRNMAAILAPIFLAVAAFLTHMVLQRLIAMERSEIGLLKAFGYSNAAVAWHYTKLVVVISALGILMGWGVGAWFGWSMTLIYGEFFRFPFIFFEPSFSLFLIAAAISLAAALLGALRAVAAAATMAPAEAMRPPAPPSYRKTPLTARLTGLFDQPTRMIFRHMSRWPLRSATTALGLAAAVALMITALQWLDAIDRLAHVQFFDAQRQDVSVGLAEPQADEVLRGLEALPGVLHAEPTRSVPARLRFGARAIREAIQGVPGDASLAPPYDVSGRAVEVPPRGLLLSTELASRLGVGPDDEVRVEVLEGRRPTSRIRVTGLFETYLGTPAFMNLQAVNRLMQEPPSISGAHLRVDSMAERRFFAELKGLPEVSSVNLKQSALEKFYETTGETTYIFISFYASFAGALAFGVTYNAVRISLSERGRELATLRVLGLTAAEISYLLLGEVVLLALASLPLGVALGYGLTWLMVDRFATELFRIPFVVDPSTLGFAVLVVLIATFASAELVRRRVYRLDLIAVLKTRE